MDKEKKKKLMPSIRINAETILYYSISITENTTARSAVQSAQLINELKMSSSLRCRWGMKNCDFLFCREFAGIQIQFARVGSVPLVYVQTIGWSLQNCSISIPNCDRFVGISNVLVDTRVGLERTHFPLKYDWR